MSVHSANPTLANSPDVPAKPAFMRGDVNQNPPGMGLWALLREDRRTHAGKWLEQGFWAVVADFEAHLDRLTTSDGRLIAFLGSTIGNLDPVERSRFFRALRAELGPGDAFLLGVDLVKAEHRLVAADRKSVV